MADYILSNETKEDLIHIHQFGVTKSRITQADKYFYSFFDYFEIIAQRPLSFESVDYIIGGYRRCPSGSDTIYDRINDSMVEIMTIIKMQDLKNILCLL